MGSVSTVYLTPLNVTVLTCFIRPDQGLEPCTPPTSVSGIKEPDTRLLDRPWLLVLYRTIGATRVSWGSHIIGVVFIIMRYYCENTLQ
ncbi:hypothetical protein LCGC14_1780270 [marine sediment metagenome]|uniref:Uncharacterized protein n=1 Tax=marine sediment metagenome TaxID=412755 RepID=A0A0F9GVK4_9ZZZZ